MDTLKNNASPDKQTQVDLTKREMEIIQLIVGEFTSREIADKLYISYHTVERHRKNIFAKLGVKNVAGLVKYAIKNGLAD